MPALFAYLIAVALLLGGGYGALNWLATPEPVKAVAKATPKAPTPHYAEHPEPAAAEASSAKPEVASRTGIDNRDRGEAASADQAVSIDQPASPSPSLQPEPPAAASRQEAKAQTAGPAQDQQDSSAHAEMPQTATDQEARQQVEPPPAEAPARHEEEKQEKQPAPAVSPGNAQTPTSIASAARMAKRPQIRQASRHSEKRPLEMMTLRTIELPDGRRMTQLIPHRSGDRYRNDGPAMVFDPDE